MTFWWLQKVQKTAPNITCQKLNTCPSKFQERHVLAILIFSKSHLLKESFWKTKILFEILEPLTSPGTIIKMSKIKGETPHLGYFWQIVLISKVLWLSKFLCECYSVEEKQRLRLFLQSVIVDDVTDLA